MSDRKYSGTPPKTKIFVGQIPENAKSSELRALFEQYGEVTECDILNRYGFVHMKDAEDATKAIKELNNTEFMGSQLSVQQSTGRSRRGRGPRRGDRNGGRSGNRGTNRGHPYMRGYDRDPFSPSRNGYFDDFYQSRGPPRMFMPRDSLGYDDMHGGNGYGRPFPSDMRMGSFDRMPYDQGNSYGSHNMDTGMFRRRSPLPRSNYASGGFDEDDYEPPGRGYW